MAEEQTTTTGTTEPGAAGNEDALRKIAYERDSERAARAKLQQQIEEIKKTLPSDEQRAKWAELEKQQETAEEEKKRKAGEFDTWRTQITDKHAKELEARQKAVDAEAAKTAAAEKELNDTLVGLAFAGASEWFGPSGKTVLLPAVAQAYFASRVIVEKDDAGNRRVIVRDSTGAPLLDPKTGKPMDFVQGIGELIDSHPQKKELLRGSGKVGSGTNGAGGGLDTSSGGPIDASQLTAEQRQDPKIIAALKRQRPRAGMVFGTAWNK